MQRPTPGVYRHYKGNLYLVLDTVKHSESEETLVLYRCMYGNYDLWVRPLANFLTPVDVNGEPVPRFFYERPATVEELAELALS
ncbi:DUF1653 domain-containing protein [Halioxenophilus sp. WMMB6]|uniref:DUF1653 domain-containing protein n=1 Tax=Halioxenophilus sp. WMMB6 TaxID=3073815 RepID=UPI00295F4BE5|nr:DUF1653 domain-containing protein [Halioxenophilus sp. WMMB6]